MGIGKFVGVAIGFFLAFGRQVLMLRENDRRYRSLQGAYHGLAEKHHLALEHAARLEQLNAEHQAMQAELIHNNEELRRLGASWERLAGTDPMTEIANHRAFQERLREEVARAQRYSYPFLLLMLDVDQFKEYNDAFGHPAGDQALREIARLLRETVREGDFVARYGGEEFVALLPQTDYDAGRQVAERIRETVQQHDFAHGRFTFSIGAARFLSDGSGVEKMIESADQALYAAKNMGRNRVVFAPEMEDKA